MHPRLRVTHLTPFEKLFPLCFTFYGLYLILYRKKILPLEAVWVTSFYSLEAVRVILKLRGRVLEGEVQHHVAPVDEFNGIVEGPGR